MLRWQAVHNMIEDVRGAVAEGVMQGLPESTSARRPNRLAHHHMMLLGCICHLHAPGSTNGRMRHVTVTSNLIGSVNNHHTLVQVIGQGAGNVPDHRRLAHAWTTQEQDGHISCSRSAPGNKCTAAAAALQQPTAIWAGYNCATEH
jgi:hypothetical protein